MNSNAKRASIILGVFMAVVLIGSTFLQLVNRDTTIPVAEPTTALDPTFPAPLDPAGLTFDEYFLHPSAIFAVAQPTGYQVSEPNTQPNIVQVNLVNNDALSVIDTFVQDPAAPFSADDLDTFFNEAVLDQSWANFQNWNETNRRRDGDNLIIDFDVRFQNQDYVARQQAWTDGEWIYVVRVLAPENATQFLVNVLDQVSDSLIPFKQFSGQPFGWNAYFDSATNAVIRHPLTWVVTDSAPGRPSSIAGDNGEALRLETQTGNLADEAAASAWVETNRPGATVLSVEPVTRGALAGYAVAYSFTTTDGEPQSGYAVLLNGEDDNLLVANLRFNADAVDLNNPPTSVIVPAAESTAEATAESTDVGEGLVPPAEAAAQPIDPNAPYYQELAEIMGSFGTLPVINLSADSLPPTPTLQPTRTPTTVPETTAEATAETTAESTDVGAGLVPPAETTAESTDVGAGLVPPAETTAEPTVAAESTAEATPDADNTEVSEPTATNTPRPSNTARPTNTSTATPTATATRAAAAPSFAQTATAIAATRQATPGS
jgi:hypothetical protein